MSNEAPSIDIMSKRRNKNHLAQLALTVALTVSIVFLVLLALKYSAVWSPALTVAIVSLLTVAIAVSLRATLRCAYRQGRLEAVIELRDSMRDGDEVTFVSDDTKASLRVFNDGRTALLDGHYSVVVENFNLWYGISPMPNITYLVIGQGIASVRGSDILNLFPNVKKLEIDGSPTKIAGNDLAKSQRLQTLVIDLGAPVRLSAFPRNINIEQIGGSM